MMKRKMRGLALVLTILLAFQSFGFVAFAATDLKGHWSEVKMNDWINKGFIKGYPDGTVKPNNKITRAEFMAIVNKAFEYSGGYSASFSDVAKTDWYYSVIAVAIANGYIGGYPDGKMKPKAPISRAEAAAIIAKVANLTADYTTASYYNDKASIPSWALGAVGAVTKAGIMSGYDGGVFSPNRPITRAETVMALSKALDLKSVGPQVYDTPGNYGSNNAVQIIKGDVSIKTANVNLRNVMITGSLMIDKAVGNGNVNLTNVQVQGEIFVYGGGINSIVFDGVTATTLYAGRKEGTVRIVATGATRIDNTIVQEDSKLEEVALNSSGFATVRIDSGNGIELELVGVKLDSLSLKATNSILNLDGKTAIDRVTVSGKSNVLRTVTGTVLSYLVADSDVTVRGAGTITKADVNASGVTFDTKPSTLTVKSGVTAPTILGNAIESWTPSTGAISVEVGTDIVIKFNKKVRLKSKDTDLTNANVDEDYLITLRTRNSSGTRVSFNASVATVSGKTVLTIDPSSDLLYDQIYYIAVDGDMLEDYDDNSLVGTMSSTFTTIVDGAPSVSSFNPTTGSTNVNVANNIVISLSERVRLVSGNLELSPTNVDSAVILRKVNSGGENVAFDATFSTVSGKTVITIDPSTNLLNGQLYYVALAEDVLEDYSDLKIIGTRSATFTTVPNSVASVAVTGGSLAVATPGGTLQMAVEVLPATALDKSVTWSVLPGTGTATISTTGLLTAVSNGTVTVKATSVSNSNVFGQAVVTLSNQLSISVTGAGNVNTISVPSGTLQMNVEVLPANAPVKTVVWTVIPGTGTATISQSGLLSASSNGTVTVKATSTTNNGVFGQTTVTISNQAASGVVVSGASGATTVATGAKLQMSAQVLPAGWPNQNVTWSVTSGTGTATIDTNSGLLTAVSEGTVSVKATSVSHPSLSGELAVTVTKPNVIVSSVVLSTPQTMITTSGGAIVISATFTPTEATNKTLVWSIESGSEFATLGSGSGSAETLTPLQVGVVVVKATANNGVVGRITIEIKLP